MRFFPKRTQSVAVLVACAVAIMLVFAFVRYRTDFNQALTYATQLDY